jgi:ribosomal silencing factor RsfS
MELEAMKQAVVDALEDIKGYDITVMDVRKLTSMASYMIVANASSSRQTKAMANNVIVKLKELGASTTKNLPDALTLSQGDAPTLGLIDDSDAARTNTA